MKYDPNKHQRRSIRLKGFDYSQEGWYYVTMVTYHRKHLFGEIIDGRMVLSEMGKIVDNEWLRTEKIRPNISMDKYIIMPNHFHGIIHIEEASNQSNDTSRRVPTMEQFGKPVSGSIPTIVRGFKGKVTKRINILRQTLGLKVWQRNYYEHVIRNEADLERIRKYIIDNPSKWPVNNLFD